MANHQVDNTGAAGYVGYNEPEIEPRGRRAPAYDGPLSERRHRPPLWVRLIGVVLIGAAVIVACGVGVGILALLRLNNPVVTTTSSQVFAVTGTPTIVLHGSAGDVNIVTGNANQVAMRVTKRVRSITSGLAQQELDAMNISATQIGNTITITERTPSIDVSTLYMDRNFELELTVPVTTNLAATISAGDLTADHLQGAVTVVEDAGDIHISGAQLSDASIRTSAGDLRLDHVTLSGNAILQATAGDIHFDGALASNTTLDVRTNTGDATLTLPVATSAHLKASAGVGDVNVSGWPTSVSGNTASADLSANPTGSISIHADVGDVTVTAR